MRKLLPILLLGGILAQVENVRADLIILDESSDNDGMTFFGGASPNTPFPFDPNHIYVQINSNSSGASIPGGFTPPNLVQFMGTSSGGNWTLTWVSGGFPAPAPFGNINAAFKLEQTANPLTDDPGVFNVVDAVPAAVITLAFTSGTYSGLVGNLQFTRFEQGLTPVPMGDNKPITAFGTFTPMMDPFGFGVGNVVLNFNNVGNGPQNELRLIVGTNTVLSQQTFSGTIDIENDNFPPPTVIPEPSALAVFAIILAVGGVLVCNIFRHYFAARSACGGNSGNSSN